jgi:hypothetical protein
MKRVTMVVVTVVVSFFLIFTFYSNSTSPYVPGISQPTPETPFPPTYPPAYLNTTVAGIRSSILIYSNAQTLDPFRTEVVDTGTTFTTLFFINVISEKQNLNPFSLGLKVTAISGYIENSSAPFKLPIINFHSYQWHVNSVIIVVYNFTYPIPPSLYHGSQYVPGNYTAAFNITIALTPTLWVYHGQSSDYVVSISYPIVMFTS